eukprot:1795520-Rhodomonas_salina.1
MSQEKIISRGTGSPCVPPSPSSSLPTPTWVFPPSTLPGRWPSMMTGRSRRFATWCSATRRHSTPSEETLDCGHARGRRCCSQRLKTTCAPLVSK